MPDNREVPTLIVTPDYSRIRNGGQAGQEELERTLRSIIDAFNQYVARKGA